MMTRKHMNDEQGIAFPMAMIVMAILAALMGAFAVLATSEPQIASNQMASAQARALAESGVERALWALSAGMRAGVQDGELTTDAAGALPSPVTAPYNGTYVTVSSIGGFKVTVADCTVPECGSTAQNEKVITARGYVPNDTNPIAIKQIKTVVMSMKRITPQCGLCAGGEGPPANVTVGGSAKVNATESSQGSPTVPAGSYCSGTPPNGGPPAAAVGSTGTVNLNGSPNLYGPPSPNPLNLDPPPPPAATQSAASFPSSTLLSDADMALYKSIAKASGTYYQGSQHWTSPPPNGIIFVDTVDGSPFSASTSPVPVVDIDGNWSGAQWSGWIIVAGTVHIAGNITLNGLVYAQNDVTVNGTGGGQINGAVISTNRVDTTSSTIADSDITGNAPLLYNCPAVRNGGGSLNKWWVKPGTYREISGS